MGKLNLDQKWTSLIGHLRATFVYWCNTNPCCIRNNNVRSYIHDQIQPVLNVYLNKIYLGSSQIWFAKHLCCRITSYSLQEKNLYASLHKIMSRSCSSHVILNAWIWSEREWTERNEHWGCTSFEIGRTWRENHFYLKHFETNGHVRFLEENQEEF